MILWSVDLVGGFKMSLPSQCPKEFLCIPEDFLDDAMYLLVLTSRIPKALESFALVSITCFAMLYSLPDVVIWLFLTFLPTVLFYVTG
jgi:ubiquitin conjugation factor E4 B